MTIYLLICGLALIGLLLTIIKINGAIFFTQITFWFFGFVGIISVLYLESNRVYIIEQFTESFPNGAGIALIALFFFHATGVLIGQKLYTQKIITLQAHRPLRHRNANTEIIAFYLISSALLALLYFNLIISPTPPFFSEGYIDRFTYLETTALWPVLSTFGAVTIPIPIMLGWLASRSRYNALTYGLIIFYLAYLTLIGQKFGGFILGVFLFLLPTIVKRAASKTTKHYAKQIIFWGTIVGCIAVIPVLYHYSRYSLSDEFGGPLGLLFYRIFGLTGHTFWGSFNIFMHGPTDEFDPSSLFNGMQNIMLLLAPSIAQEMIERGVNFTFGYFAANLLYLSILAPFLLILFGFFQFLISYFLTKFVINEKPIEYFCVANLLVSASGFYGQGSLSYALNIKTVFLGATLILILSMKRFLKSRRVAHRRYENQDCEQLHQTLRREQ